MEFIKRHRRFLINTLIYIISFVVIVIPMNMWIYKGLNLYRLGKSAVYVFVIWFGVSAIVAIIKYFANKKVRLEIVIKLTQLADIFIMVL